MAHDSKPTTMPIVNGTSTYADCEHFKWTKEHHHTFIKYARSDEAIIITGDHLTLAELVACSRERALCKPATQQSVLDSIDASIDFLNERLEAGPIYGISTGFGGSADTRTTYFADLQKALLQHHHVGVLVPEDTGLDDPALGHLPKHCLPRPIVRGAMMARCNSLMRGHSAVRREVIGAMLNLLNLDFIPVVPLRGSISASGDLTPLSYIAGALEGNTGISVDCRLEHGQRKIMNAREAMRLAKIDPLTLGPKEGLGIMNGTTVSCAAASIGLHEAQFLALMTQALTGMCTEALAGTVENFHSFIATSRPHPGLVEAAANITRYLRQSQLAGSHDSGRRTNGLYQDRYALRTAGQWIAPYLEDLVLAEKQLTIELNSTTDNPLIDAESKRIHHGGNFQATSITSATEKIRLSLQMFGKLLFAQNAEVINPMLNGVLPPNLSFDDPSLSFAFKGVEINMAAYMAELAFLANPISSHVQPAEMGNQAVNSMALVSSRYTMEAVEMVGLMCAAHLYTLCQALDLQVLRLQYMKEIEQQLDQVLSGQLPDEPEPESEFAPASKGKRPRRPSLLLQSLATESKIKDETPKKNDTGPGAPSAPNGEHRSQDATEKSNHSADTTTTTRSTLLAALIQSIDQALINTKTKDASQQAEAAGDAVLLELVRPPTLLTIEASQMISKDTAKIVLSCIQSARKAFAKSPVTDAYLSNGSSLLYRYVRNDLGVPLHKGLVEHATYNATSPEGIAVEPMERELIGAQIGKIYKSIRSGDVYGVLVESLS